ncbi:MipA/OmpV family protein [Polycladidibacter hongkongensis]|uniref:MipA/OmpV family protein n=1 Tax=Polycladidibacter hongkongensis TaxID=1647556 RepID=UPI001AD8A830|nr:MipA/OmpV family protein [Pseudovibrio hongkongensis]
MAALPFSAQADDDFLTADLNDEQMQKQYVLDVGIGGFMNTKYDGSDEYIFYPVPLIGIGRFYIPMLGQVEDGAKERGFFIYPSFGFVGGRDESDSDRLKGTKKIPWAGEIGLGAGYRYGMFRVFGDLRHGFNGHTGWVGRAGVDVITKPFERITFSIGPRIDYASDSYMDTYFSTPSTADAGVFEADGGIKSVGAIVRTSYAATETVSLHLQGGYDRLIGDAADSPISQNDDQWTIGVGATYRMSFDLFD